MKRGQNKASINIFNCIHSTKLNHENWSSEISWCAICTKRSDKPLFSRTVLGAQLRPARFFNSWHPIFVPRISLSFIFAAKVSRTMAAALPYYNKLGARWWNHPPFPRAERIKGLLFEDRRRKGVVWSECACLFYIPGAWGEQIKLVVLQRCKTSSGSQVCCFFQGLGEVKLL